MQNCILWLKPLDYLRFHAVGSVDRACMKHYIGQNWARPNLYRLFTQHFGSVLKRLLICLISVALVVIGATNSRVTPSMAAPSALHSVFLPLVTFKTDTIFGLNTSSLTPERGLEDIVAL